MGKAILVMDMPESCMGCNFMYCDAENNSESCQAKETARVVDLEKESKPDWCPLRPIPEELELNKIRQEAIEEDCYDDTNGIDEAYLQGKVSGWNACIDAMGGDESE